MELKPSKGGFSRPFGCGWFIREYLLGNGPSGSIKIDAALGDTQSDICYQYKEAIAGATAQTHAESIISNMVVAGNDVTEAAADKIYQRELKKVSRKFSHMRYHSFLMYFGVLKRLGWVEETGQTETSTLQDKIPEAPSRVYYHLTEAGKAASDVLWSNPMFTLYPENGANHRRKSE